MPDILSMYLCMSTFIGVIDSDIHEYLYRVCTCVSLYLDVKMSVNTCILSVYLCVAVLGC